MTARAFGGSDDQASDRILRASFWSALSPSHVATVIELSAARLAR